MRYARVTAVALAATATVAFAGPSVFAADRAARPAAPPSAVTIVSVGPGAGSGEVQLVWAATPDAAGYRVLRAGTAGGPFQVAAEIDVTTGVATAAAGVVNVFSDQHSYVPPLGSLAGRDRAAQFSYVDVGPGQRCYRVTAFNADGAGPASAVACAVPPGGAPEPATPIAGQPTFTG